MSNLSSHPVLPPELFVKVNSAWQKWHNEYYRQGQALSLARWFWPNENTISKILRELLSPQGAHGQEDFFLRNFLELVLPEARYAALEHGVVTTERRTNPTFRRLDIFIELPDAIIGIENKFGAEDQYLQLADYLDWLKKHMEETGKKDYQLIYLSPAGRVPAHYSLPEESLNGHHKDHFKRISWQEVLELFNKITADFPFKVKFFIEELSNIIRAQKLGLSMEETSANAIAAELAASASEKELMAAQLIRDNYDEAAAIIINDWSERLEAALLKENLIIEREIIRPLPQEWIPIKISYPDFHTAVGVWSVGMRLPVEYGIWPDYRYTESPEVQAFTRILDTHIDGNIFYHNRRFNALEDYSFDNPHLLARMRDQKNIFLYNELKELCAEVEEIIKKIKKSV